MKHNTKYPYEKLESLFGAVDALDTHIKTAYAANDKWDDDFYMLVDNLIYKWQYETHI